MDMNICFFMDGFDGGGIGRVTSIIANELQKNPAYQIFALCYAGNPEKDIYPLDKAIKEEYIYPTRQSMTKTVLKGHLISKVDAFVKENQIDLIIACGAQFYPVAVIVAKKNHRKVWCWEHTDPRNKRDYRFQDESRVFGARLSDLNIVLNKSAWKVYHERFPKKRSIQIYNPIDPALLLDEKPYQASSKKIISVGRLRPPKNFDRLLDVARVVMDRHPDWTWDIWGEGELRASLEAKIDRLNLRENVFLRGHTSRIYELYPEYSMIVMTSDYEGFPMTLLEGAAKGLPMISFDIPTGPSEIIRDGDNGYLIPDGELGEMADRIDQLINDAEKRQNMAEESRHTAELFRVEHIVKQWMSLFDEAETE